MLIGAVEQERVSRNKHAVHETPTPALSHLLAAHGLQPTDVSRIVVGWDRQFFAPPFDSRLARLVGELTALGVPDVSSRLHFVEHHVAHAAASIAAAAVDDAAVLVVDGRGERDAITTFDWHDGRLSSVSRRPISSSIGHFFECAAHWIGLGRRGAGKLMGLAAYAQARPTDVAALSAALLSPAPTHDDAAAQIAHQRALLTKSFGALIPRCARLTEQNFWQAAAFAAAVQLSSERMLMELAVEACATTGRTRLLLGGGVALNCTANGRLVDKTPWRQVFIPPFPHDAGVAIGALAASEPRRLEDVSERIYFGPQPGAPSDDVLRGLGFRWQRFADVESLCRLTARLIDGGAVVGWCVGPSEFGPRSLGARSILAKANDRGQLHRVNAVKGREPWRPLAPAILEEHFSDWFGIPPTLSDRHMLVARSVTPPAVTSLGLV